MHVCPPWHTCPHVPQFVELDVVSMQLAGDPQSAWPATLHPQTPPLHVDPPAQIEHALPQWAESVVELQAPSEHVVLPDGQVAAHDPLSHTWGEGQGMQPLPQCVESEATQEPPHETSPDAQTHDPFAQVVPVPQVAPHFPQFCSSLVTSTHAVPQGVRPPLHVGPKPAGTPPDVAQLTITKSARDTAAARVNEEERRPCIFRLLRMRGRVALAPAGGDDLAVCIACGWLPPFEGRRLG
jgi:hypothetical protein